MYTYIHVYICIPHSCFVVRHCIWVYHGLLADHTLIHEFIPFTCFHHYRYIKCINDNMFVRLVQSSISVKKNPRRMAVLKDMPFKIVIATIKLPLTTVIVIVIYTLTKDVREHMSACIVTSLKTCMMAIFNLLNLLGKK